MYVVSSPTIIGNVFGFYGCRIPDGMFAVVIDGEYANGGYGPSAEREPSLFPTAADAERAIVARLAAIAGDKSRTSPA